MRVSARSIYMRGPSLSPFLKGLGARAARALAHLSISLGLSSLPRKSSSLESPRASPLSFYPRASGLGPDSPSGVHLWCVHLTVGLATFTTPSKGAFDELRKNSNCFSMFSDEVVLCVVLGEAPIVLGHTSHRCLQIVIFCVVQSRRR